MDSAWVLVAYGIEQRQAAAIWEREKIDPLTHIMGMDCFVCPVMFITIRLSLAKVIVHIHALFGS